MGHYAAFSNNQEMVLILHKRLDGRVEKLNHLTFGVKQPKIKKKSNPNFQQVNKPYRISPHEVLQSWLINTVYHLLIWLWTISREEKGV